MTIRLSLAELEVLDAVVAGGNVRKLYAAPCPRHANLNRPLRPYLEVVAAAAAELRDTDFSPHDYRVLEAIRDRLDGDERELVERLLTLVAPRSWP